LDNAGFTVDLIGTSPFPAWINASGHHRVTRTRREESIGGAEIGSRASEIRAAITWMVSPVIQRRLHEQKQYMRDTKTGHCHFRWADHSLCIKSAAARHPAALRRVGPNA
jgi:hypothetical protein